METEDESAIPGLENSLAASTSRDPEDATDQGSLEKKSETIDTVPSPKNVPVESSLRYIPFTSFL